MVSGPGWGERIAPERGNLWNYGRSCRKATFRGLDWMYFRGSDSAGNLWLFGGVGADSKGTQGVLNDLWKYSGGQWTWMGGSSLADQVGTYGMQGTPSAGNIPGARQGNATWVDNDGNFWLLWRKRLRFDRSPADTLTIYGKYSPVTCQLTWVSVSNLGYLTDVYGTKGVHAGAYFPGGRYGETTWTDFQAQSLAFRRLWRKHRPESGC